MEIEIKARIADLVLLRRKIIRQGARPIRRVHQVDYYYSLYKRPLNKTKGSIVRIRHTVDRGTVTFEYDTAKNAIAAEEVEVTVNDLPTMQRLMRLMRAKLEVVVDKRREYFRSGKLEIVLDRVRGLGTFSEVEIQGKDSKANRQRIERFYQSVGVTRKDYVLGPKYNSMLLKQKGKKYAYF